MSRGGDMTIPIVGVVLCGAAVVGLVLWGRARAVAGMGQDDPGLDVPKPTRIGPFPDLKVGTVILVDTAAATLPPPFNSAPQMPGVVDQILRDPLLVSARFGGPSPLPSFSGTIPRSAILKILAEFPPGLGDA